MRVSPLKISLTYSHQLDGFSIGRGRCACMSATCRRQRQTERGVGSIQRSLGIWSGHPAESIKGALCSSGGRHFHQRRKQWHSDSVNSEFSDSFCASKSTKQADLKWQGNFILFRAVYMWRTPPPFLALNSAIALAQRVEQVDQWLEGRWFKSPARYWTPTLLISEGPAMSWWLVQGIPCPHPETRQAWAATPW